MSQSCSMRGGSFAPNYDRHSREGENPSVRNNPGFGVSLRLPGMMRQESCCTDSGSHMPNNNRHSRDSGNP